MRYGIITDVHANLQALHALWAFAKEQNIDEVFCAGDIVGCGGNPQECIEFIKDNGIVAIAGNHDWAVCGKRSLDFFDMEGQEVVLWTRQQLTQENIEYLQNLPIVFKIEHFTMVHATLNDPEKFMSVDDEEDLIATFHYMQEQVCFIGHTHEPSIMMREHEQITYPGDFVVLEPHAKYLVNAGSAGQPRDNNPKACIVIYDTQTATISIKRVDYDIEGAQQAIIKAGLPKQLSDRLAVGQ